jgi:hypothetical protein
MEQLLWFRPVDSQSMDIVVVNAAFREILRAMMERWAARRENRN